MKKERFMAGLAVLLIAAAGIGCTIPTGAEKTGLLVIKVTDRIQHPLDRLLADLADGESRGMVHDPMPLASELTISIEGTGPGEASFSSTITMGTAVREQLAAGAWTFSARAVDVGGNVLLQGSASSTVEPANGANVSILLKPLPGDGALCLSYTTPAEVNGTSVWQCSLVNGEGAIVATWEDAIGNQVRTVEELPAGYYSLYISISDAGVNLGGRTDVVRIVNGRTTSASIDLETARASVSFGISIDDDEPIPISTQLLSRAAVRGFPMVVGVSASPATSWVWSQNGLGMATGSIATIQTATLPLSGTIDLAVFGNGRAGAADFNYVLDEALVCGGWAWYTDVTAVEEPASTVLSRPAMVSASADGQLLAIASDGSSSTVEIWKKETASGESRPVSVLALSIGGSTRKATTIRFAPDGRHLAAANSESGWIWLAPVDSEGVMGSPVEVTGGSAGLEGMGYVRGICFSPTGDLLFALSNANRSVYAFRLENAAWVLEERTELDALPCGVMSVYKSMAISADGTMLAIAAAGSDTVIFLGVADTGLTWLGEARKNSGFADLDYPQALAFNPDGSSLAVACKDSASVVFISCPPIAVSCIAVVGSADGLPGIPSGLSFAADGSMAAVSCPGGLSLVKIDGAGMPQSLYAMDASMSPSLATPGTAVFSADWLYVPCPEAGTLAIIRKMPEEGL